MKVTAVGLFITRHSMFPYTSILQQTRVYYYLAGRQSPELVRKASVFASVTV